MSILYLTDRGTCGQGMASCGNELPPGGPGTAVRAGPLSIEAQWALSQHLLSGGPGRGVEQPSDTVLWSVAGAWETTCFLKSAWHRGVVPLRLQSQWAL